MEEMQQHQGEWFFLHELNVDKVFSTIQRADYLILYYIKVEQEAHPGEKLYLADLAAAMGLRVTELSKEKPSGRARGSLSEGAGAA